MRSCLLTQVLKPLLSTSGRSLATAHGNPLIRTHSIVDTELEEALEDATRRRRKTEWKRRQRGQSFLDFSIIHVRGGSGGNGCVAFHREKYKPFGPPSGGNGGRGGDVYILPTPHLTTLSSVPKRIRGDNGTNGMGSWQNGRSGPPLVIKVPLGTVVKELPRDDPRRSKDEYEAEEEGLEGLSLMERRQKIRDSRWLHYPGYDDANVERDTFKEAEQALFAQERERRRARRLRSLNPILLDLDKIEEAVVSDDAPLGTGHREPLGHLIASGGHGGVGNPYFLSQLNRSPKFATRGYGGERRTFSLELKLLADVGLVGFPNAGKSTLLRALTGGRAKTEVAAYAFTTLNPVIGVVRVADDGTFEGAVQGQMVYDETLVEAKREWELLEGEQATDASTTNDISTDESSDDFDSEYRAQCDIVSDSSEDLRPGHHFDIVETFRFTIADNPGLISRASENVGLGHSFLRSMERSLALVYVVDLAGPAPWDELRVLRDELEKYKPGMSGKARMVVANKADLIGGDGDSAAVEEARRKLRKLEAFVRTDFGCGNADCDGESSAPRPIGSTLDVIPISAKFSQNLMKVVGLLRTYVEDARGDRGPTDSSTRCLPRQLTC